jgi:RES domain-containing protein
LVIDDELLAALESIAPIEFEAIVFRHTLAEAPPLRPNSRGARWNPRDVPALYTSLERVTAIAEGDRLLALQTPRPKGSRHLHRIQVRLDGVVDLRSWEVLESLGIDQDAVSGDDFFECQRIGEAALRLGLTGLLVPSARSDGANLVIIDPNSNDYEIEVISTEVIP